MTDLTGVIDRSSPVPFHLQLRKLLEHEIQTGRWPQDGRLPSEPFLSEYYSVSRATVRQALHALEQQGLIRKEKGRGAFVNRTSPGSWFFQWAGGLFDDELSRSGVTVESTVLRACTERLPDWAADALQLARGADGVTLERLRRVDGELASYVVNHLPNEYVAVLTEIQKEATASLYWTLREQCSVEVAGSSRTLEAVAASASLARHLGVRSRFPLVYIQSVTRDAASKPIDCYRAWLRTDRLRIALETDTWSTLAGRVVSHSFLGVPNDDASPSAQPPSPRIP
ncbi:MAG: GntR family transcriptional regulator [Acidimicrobiales bacterium]|jgi:GntR family transcriptional regulator